MHALIRASGAIAAAGPLLSLLGGTFHPGWLARGLSPHWMQAWPVWLLWLASVAMTVGGVVMPRWPDLGRNLVVAGVGAWCIQAALPATEAPMLVLAASSAVVMLAHWLWPVAPPHREEAERQAQMHSAVSRARAACIVALLGWPLIWLSGIVPDAGVAVAHGASLSIGALLVLRVLGYLPRWVVATLAGSLIVMVVALVLAAGRVLPSLSALSLLPIAGVVLLRSQDGRLTAVIFDAVATHPARLLAVTFLGMSALGGALLRLPFAAAGPERLAGIDAAFTATSAVCVTGLIVLHTPDAFSGAGQAVLVVLIQLGGLGIMSFSTAAIAALGRRLSLRQEAALADLVSGNREDLFVTLRRLFAVTFTAEALGTACLWPLFHSHGDGMAEALWRAVFTAVSAFCNAGFALQNNSLILYQQDPLVLNVVAALIIVGGLSPAVVLALPSLLRRRASLQVKVIVTTSAALLVAGFLILGALEWSHAFSHLSWGHRIDAAWFQSVTLRTAGFNSVDFEALRPATRWVMLAFMFIGGSPGGTAGGIKVTTAAVLLLALRGAMRGRWEATLFRRRLTHKTFYEATTITTVAALYVFVGVVALSVTQSLPLESALFEVVSAAGTVGLSVGATSKLDDVGKIIIMVLMFIGRIGPLTLFLFLKDRHTDRGWELPESELDVG